MTEYLSSGAWWLMKVIPAQQPRRHRLPAARARQTHRSIHQTPQGQTMNKLLCLFAALALTGCAHVGTGYCHPRPDGSKICKLIVDRSQDLPKTFLLTLR
jgi:hypothetical protein